MKKTDLYRAAQNITPDPYQKERLAAKLEASPPPVRRRVIGTLVATAMLIAIIAVPLWVMNGGENSSDTETTVGAGIVTPSQTIPEGDTPETLTKDPNELLQELKTKMQYSIDAVNGAAGDTLSITLHMEDGSLRAVRYNDGVWDELYEYLCDTMSVLTVNRVRYEVVFTSAFNHGAVIWDGDKWVDDAVNTEEIYISENPVPFLFPVPGYYSISSPFGSRIHPVYETIVFHNGIDIAAPGGTPVIAAHTGIVNLGEDEEDGLYLWIRGSEGRDAYYANLSGYAEGVTDGQTVNQGNIIGYVGSTGVSTGNHLHFGVYVDGEAVDPSSFSEEINSVLLVQEYAQAVMDRDGQAQFALFDEALQEVKRAEFEGLNWVTGTSSPWITGYELKSAEKSVDEETETVYILIFHTATSIGRFEDEEVLIRLNEADGKITEVSEIISR